MGFLVWFACKKKRGRGLGLWELRKIKKRRGKEKVKNERELPFINNSKVAEISQAASRTSSAFAGGRKDKGLVRRR